MSENDEWDLAIGRLVRETTLLEHAVAVLMWGLTDVHQETGRVALPNGLDRMLDVCNHLTDLRVKDPELAATLKASLAKVRILSTRRNVFVHSVWIPEGEHRWRATLKPLTAQPAATQTLEDLQDASSEALAARRELGTLSVEAKKHLGGEWSVS